MSGQDPLQVAYEAERDLNSEAAKRGVGELDRSSRHGKGPDDSTLESGVNTAVTEKFPGSTVTYGSAASGQGGNREIPDEEGGGVDKRTGRQTKAKDFEGVGGPEDKAAEAQVTRGGDDDVPGNVRQGGETRRP